jgi:2-polyprenyl-3-methyl-5-hydroxy-6-metoxy-1,4-benzoquinol methylase
MAHNLYSTVSGSLKTRLASGKVLDIPCGDGAFAKCLTSAGYETIAADLMAPPASLGVAILTTDMDEALPFADGTFHAITCLEGIEHIRRPFDFIQECSRVLHPGGYLFLTTPNISSIRSRWRWFLTGFRNKCKYPLDEANPAPRHHINMLSFPALRYMLHTKGFQMEAVTTNKIKPTNLLYLPWVPVQYAASWLAFRRRTMNEKHRQQTAEIFKQMLSMPILLGEISIVVATARPRHQTILKNS